MDEEGKEEREGEHRIETDLVWSVVWYSASAKRNRKRERARKRKRG